MLQENYDAIVLYEFFILWYFYIALVLWHEEFWTNGRPQFGKTFVLNLACRQSLWGPCSTQVNRGFPYIMYGWFSIRHLFDKVLKIST